MNVVMHVRLRTETETLRRSWITSYRAVRLLRDALDVSVDDEMRSLVAILRMCGFTTMSSCGGHPERPTDGPYVILQCDPARAAERDAIQLVEATERLAALKACRLQTLRQADRLRLLVERFEAQRDLSSSSARLEVRPIGYAQYRLCFVHSDFSSILEPAEHQCEILRRQRAIEDFARFVAPRTANALAPGAQS